MFEASVTANEDSVYGCALVNISSSCLEFHQRGPDGSLALSFLILCGMVKRRGVMEWLLESCRYRRRI